MITKPVLIDAGPLVALLYRKEAQHDRCVEQSKELPQTLYTCWPAVTEAAYLLKPRRTGVESLLSQIEHGRLQILPLSPEDVRPISAILAKYHDQGFDLADVCLMHLAEREGIDHVFTLDRRHFSLFRTKSGQPLQLLPTA